jgi:NAD(P)-dependent dehydrogenase (short-subunit alcohol dehydrogenase family)
MSDVWRYDGKRVVVTGCSSGMGEAATRELLGLGADVIGLDVNQPQLEIGRFEQMDQGDPASIDRAVAAIGGPVDALFNCAGVSGWGREPRDVFRINFAGMRHLTEGLIPRLFEGGAVASVASLYNIGFTVDLGPFLELAEARGFADALAWWDARPAFQSDGYGTAKLAIQTYTMVRAVELGSRGIRVNCLSPGPTDTPMLVDSAKKSGREFLDTFPTPLGRRGRPEEQARVLVFFNSAAASYVTGQIVWCDGGHAAGVITGMLDSAAVHARKIAARG